MSEVLVALDSFTIQDSGVRRFVRYGQPVRADDPIVAGRESLFAKQSDMLDGERPVESATAAPGEKRNTGRKPAKSAGAAKG